jgi:hypothetical protein
MQYALLIYTEETPGAVPEDVMASELEDYNRFTEDIQARGILRAGEALHPSGAATTVRVRDGRTLTTDGPFAETKEVLGGLYLVDATDLDEAIELAARIPGARHGSVEVRPVWEFAGAADGTTGGQGDRASAGSAG